MVWVVIMTPKECSANPEIYPIPLRSVPQDLRPVLCLHVAEPYFGRIRSGEKKTEFREIKDYWKKRLEGRSYKAVVISNRQSDGYKDPVWLIFPWNGYLEYPFGGAEEIFGKGDRLVYAIPLMFEQRRDTPASA
jgi:hypothetical protein